MTELPFCHLSYPISVGLHLCRTLQYSHHVATSDHVSGVLKIVYMFLEERVHVILNGVDEHIFNPYSHRGIEFQKKSGIPTSKALILGLVGRLVNDKGHPIMFEVLNQMFNEYPKFRDGVVVLVAGDSPWGNRYRELGINVVVLGPLEQSQLVDFYNAIDIFKRITYSVNRMNNKKKIFWGHYARYVMVCSFNCSAWWLHYAMFLDFD